MIRIGITLGDPSGIGPEIALKALNRISRKNLKITLIGNRDNMFDIAKLSGISTSVLDNVNIVDIPGSGIEFGMVRKTSGHIAVSSIEAATKMALDGEIDAIVTAPINKEAIKLAGSKYIDHTTMLAGLTASSNVTTVFEVRKLRIIFVTKHMSLIDACRSINQNLIFDYIMYSDWALRSLGMKNGRIAVAALNPHGGENGLFGREEIYSIIPAVERASKMVNVSGPYPADSVFHQAALGKYDIVLSLYHDQGHIAAKMYDFDRTVSMNLGLPFLRTSVDHGTAFDIAGRGIAEEISMVEAIKKAKKYALPYKKFVSAENREL
jgi:4-hydroxythreonine-4-phosphate dehydrogenase